MANVTSTLTMRLIDGVSGNAAKVKRSIGEIDGVAKRAAGGRKGTIGGVPLLSSGMGALGTAIGGYASVRGVMAAERAYADFDRRMTRIGITADATGDQVKSATSEVKKIADEVALPIHDVVNGLDVLVATGRALPEAMSFLPSIARTAQASGAATEDIAAAANTLGVAFGITGEKMQNAFDILVTGGKLGQFELKDMAAYIPTLGSTVANMGWKGEEGLIKLVSMLQVVRARTGSAEEAATNLRNVFQKWKSAPVEKQLRKYGVDLPKVLAKAHKEGKDEFEAFMGVLDDVTKKHPDALQRIFTDQQAFLGALALMQARANGELKDYSTKLGNSAGAVTKDLAKVTGDAASSMERFGNAMSTAGQSAGRLADAAGLSSLLQNIATAADAASSRLDHFSTLVNEKGFVGAVQETRRTSQEEAWRPALQTDSRAKAFSDAYVAKTGQLPPLDEAMSWVDNAYTALFRNRGEVIAEAAAAGEAAGERDLPNRYKSMEGHPTGRHWVDQPSSVFGPPAAPGNGGAPIPRGRPANSGAAPIRRAIRTVPQGPDGWRYGDFTLGSGAEMQFGSEGRPRTFSTQERNIVNVPNALAPSAWDAPELKPPTVRTIDLGPQAAATMESYGTELEKQMAGIEQKVDAFRSRLAAKLSFTANPRVNVRLTSTAAPVSATSSPGHEAGKKVSAHLRGGYYDNSYRYGVA